MEISACVLLLTSDPNRQSAWRAALVETDFQFVTAAELASLCETIPALIVTDGPSLPNDQLERKALGIVSIGGQTAADICLPNECSDNQLRIACRSVAEVVRLRCQLRSLSQRVTELGQLAYRDALTDLANRRAWDEQFPARARDAVQQQQSLCLALLDLDDFKQLNDQLGFRGGDRILQHVGRVITRTVRPPGDFAARLGGDEFALLISGLRAGEAFDVVESLRARLSASDDVAVVASAGLCCANPIPVDALGEWFDAADRTLREAKRQGGNRTMANTFPNRTN